MNDATYHLNGGYKPTTKRFADLEGPDFFPTPAWATHALMKHERFEGGIWECACGNGAMSEVMKTYGSSVESSDLYDRGYGAAGIDFLAATERVDNIVTNPPYNAAEGFVHKGLELACNKFALLLRLAFLEGGNRQKTIFTIAPRLVFGCSVNGLHFIQPMLKEKEVEPLLMHGLFGIKMVRRPQS